MQSATFSPEAGRVVDAGSPLAPGASTEATRVATDVLARLEAAWNDADGAAFGAVYAADASFVTIRGEHIVGSTAIGAGHAGIFSTIYAGSVNRMELVRATEISEGVVLAVSVNTLDCPTGPLAGVHQAMSTSIITVPADGAAQVVSTHNTLVKA
jgi:uncharacterized protein (TIGR02246 family)